MTIKKQTAKDTTWLDEKGMSIPYTRTTGLERKKETLSHSLLTKALDINAKLIDFKKAIADACSEVYMTVMREAEVKKPGKGNFTWFNFDRSIKIEVNINELIRFDEAMILACKAKLDEFLDESLNDKESFIKDVIKDAFETSKGKLDSNKVLSLLKHKHKVKAVKFQDAMTLIEKSISRPDSKTYYGVSIRNSEGEYEPVQLNFSSIK